MAPIELKVSRIGNSRGVRIPAVTLERYNVGDALLMEERSDGILLRPVGPGIVKLSWEETAREMATAVEDWSGWDVAAADGLAELPWAPSRSKKRVAEESPKYKSRSRKRKR